MNIFTLLFVVFVMLLTVFFVLFVNPKTARKMEQLQEKETAKEKYKDEYHPITDNEDR